jgi:hypothetical protein
MNKNELLPQTKEGQLHDDCLCIMPFFHSRFPSQLTQEAMYGSTGGATYGFADVVYNKSNSLVYHLGADTKLRILKPGTYLAHIDVNMTGVSGPASGAACGGQFILESGDGISPYEWQEVNVTLEDVGPSSFALRQKRHHGMVMLHVGDVDYGIGAYSGILSFNLQVWGDWTYAAEMHMTIEKIG